MTSTSSEPKIFNWRLNPDDYKTTIFDKKKMTEHTNIKMIYGFIKNNLGIAYQGIKRYEGIPYKTEIDQMIKYKECFNKMTKNFQVSFQLPKHKYGRVTPCNHASLCVYHRPTRHSLCKDVYKDIDMVNAHPTIFAAICSQHGLDVPALKNYTQNPKQIREMIIEHHGVSKDTAKMLPLTLMFGGSYAGWVKENNVIKNENSKIKEISSIESEMKQIIEIVYSSNKDTIEKMVLKHDSDKWKTVDEKKRGVMALWGQSIERLLQETTISYLVEEKGFTIENIVPCQDGFMILKELWYDNILNDCEKVLFDKFGIQLNYVEKPFDEAIEIPLYECDKTDQEWFDSLSAKKLADRFLKEWGDYIIIENDKLYVFREQDGIGRWYDETNKKVKMTLYISEDLYNIIECEINSAIELSHNTRVILLRDLRNMTCKGTAFSDIIRLIIPNVKVVKELFNKKDYLLGFENGVVDLKNHEFRNYQFDDYMTISTRYDYKVVDYDDDENIRLREELITIIESIQPEPELRTLYLQILASGLDGRAYQKMFLFNGQGGNGKGFTGAMMGRILGDYYYQAPNGLLKDIDKAGAASPDLYNCIGKRYINFKEVEGKIKVATLRNLTGGGEFTARLLHNNPVQFKMNATQVQEFNNPPELDGKPQASDYRRLTHIEFPINFTDDVNKIGKVIDGVLYKKANSLYETEDFQTSMKPIFLDLLLGVYKRFYCEGIGIRFDIPQSVRVRTEKFIEDQNLFQKVFNDLYQVVNDNNQKIKYRDLWSDFQCSEDYTQLKSRRAKQEYGRDEFYKWLNKFQSFETPQGVKYVTGVNRKNCESPCDDIDSDDETKETY